jgi:LPS sulfotransferase NodH
VLLDARNSDRHDLSPTTAAARSYLIASTPRTGSTLLCRALWDLDRIGAPKEYLNPVQVRDWQVRLGGPGVRLRHQLLRGPLVGLAGRGPWSDARLRHHLDGVRARRSSPDGWFGLKLHHHHQVRWFERPGRDLDDWFVDARWIRVSREDRLGQALSWVRARQTGQWADHRPARRPPRYRRRAIDAALRDIERGERGWDRILAGRPVLHLSYEELATDLGGCVRRVLDHLGVPGEVPDPTPALSPQADAVSESWRARYLAGR